MEQRGHRQSGGRGTRHRPGARLRRPGAAGNEGGQGAAIRPGRPDRPAALPAGAPGAARLPAPAPFSRSARGPVEIASAARAGLILRRSARSRARGASSGPCAQFLPAQGRISCGPRESRGGTGSAALADRPVRGRRRRDLHPADGPPPGEFMKKRRGSTRRVWRTLGAAVWRLRRRTLAAFGLVVLATLAAVSVPIYLKRIIDELSVPDVALALPVYLLLAYAILRLLVTVFSELRDVVFARVVQTTVADFLVRAFTHLHELGPRFHNRRQTGGLTRDVERGTAGVGFLLGVALFTIVPTLIEMIAVVMIMTLAYSNLFTAIIVATFVVYSVFTVAFTER